MKKILAILTIAMLCGWQVAWAGPQVSGGSSVGIGTLTNGKYCIYTTGTGIVCNTNAPQAAFSGTPEQGDVVYYNGSAWISLPHGNSGELLKSGGHGANPSWTGSITASIASLEVLIDCNGSADPYAYCTSANASTLTAAYTSRTIINSYGRGEAQTVTLPAAAEGYTFIALVGTQHNSAWKIQRAGSDTITWSSGGTDTTGKTYFQETNQPVGSRVSCITYKTGASAWSWLCGSVTGTWTTD